MPTETLEAVPRQWKVIQTVRERFSCRSCDTITQPGSIAKFALGHGHLHATLDQAVTPSSAATKPA